MNESKLKHLKIMWDRIGDHFLVLIFPVISAVRGDWRKRTSDKDLGAIRKDQAEEKINTDPSCTVGNLFFLGHCNTVPGFWQFMFKIFQCFCFLYSFSYLIMFACNNVRREISRPVQWSWLLSKSCTLRYCLFFMIPEALGQLLSYADK